MEENNMSVEFSWRMLETLGVPLQTDENHVECKCKTNCVLPGRFFSAIKKKLNSKKRHPITSCAHKFSFRFV